MGRVNPIAVVYMLTNVMDGNKIYIGETSNFVDRMSAYRTVARGRGSKQSRKRPSPIHKAVQDYGFDAFAIQVLESERDDPQLVDYEYRRMREAYYIDIYHACNPDIGYNELAENHVRGHKRKAAHHHTPRTKILKTEPILVYDHENNTTMLYLGSQSCADLLGISDRSIVISAIKKGKTIHNCSFYKLNFSDRMDIAIKVVEAKTSPYEHLGVHHEHNTSAMRSLERYIIGLNKANEWCIEFGYDCIDIDTLLIEHSK